MNGKRQRYRAGQGILSTAKLRRHELQRRFFQALNEEAPEVGRDLWSRLNEIGPGAVLTGAEKAVTELATEFPSAARIMAILREPTPGLDRVIQEWMSAHHIDVPWVRDVARAHAVLWIHDSDLAGLFFSSPGVAETIPGPVRDFDRDFIPDADTPTEYLKRVLEAQARDPAAARQSVNEGLALYKKAGYKRAPANRDPEILHAFVRYQVEGGSLSETARQLYGDPSAAKNTAWARVQRLASDLGLPLRPSLPRGRKPATLDPKDRGDLDSPSTPDLGV
jgi:hypothetical protein